jgi:hypothetical protein
MSKQELWQQEAQRLGGPIFAEVLIEMRDSQRLSGFPGDDIDGHRRYHESVIEWRELRNKMVREGLIKVAQAGMLAGTGILVGVLWKALKISITQ